MTSATFGSGNFGQSESGLDTTGFKRMHVDIDLPSVRSPLPSPRREDLRRRSEKMPALAGLSLVGIERSQWLRDIAPILT